MDYNMKKIVDDIINLYGIRNDRTKTDKLYLPHWIYFEFIKNMKEIMGIEIKEVEYYDIFNIKYRGFNIKLVDELMELY
jgi:hypothetical protein